MAPVCKCGSSNIEEDEVRGVSVCMACGEVLSNNLIVSEVTFTNERSVVEQYVGADGQISSGIHGHTKSSLAVTINNGRGILQKLSHHMKLSPQHVDAALAYYKMAAEHRFITGRRSDDVAACCMYIVCREEQTMHMLLDFADQLKINVYKLAATFLKLRLKLRLNLTIVDPVIFVPRFANALNLGEKRRDVGRTAVRIVSRMKRDWLHVGRRPAGVCGAALLIAARIHGFARTQKEVMKAVKVASTTISQRLHEFACTPSGKLNVDEFMSVDLAEEADPPSFQRGTEEEDAVEQAEALANTAAFSHLDDEDADVRDSIIGSDGDGPMQRLALPAPQDDRAGVIADSGITVSQQASAKSAEADSTATSDANADEGQASLRKDRRRVERSRGSATLFITVAHTLDCSADDNVHQDEDRRAGTDGEATMGTATTTEPTAEKEIPVGSAQEPAKDGASSANGDRDGSRDVTLCGQNEEAKSERGIRTLGDSGPEGNAITSSSRGLAPIVRDDDGKRWETSKTEDLSEDEDDDLDNYLLSEEEIQVRKQQWALENQAHVDRMAAKKLENAKHKKSARTPSTRLPPHLQTQHTAAERLKTEDTAAKSSRINYAALSSLFGDDDDDDDGDDDGNNGDDSNGDGGDGDKNDGSKVEEKQKEQEVGREQEKPAKIAKGKGKEKGKGKREAVKSGIKEGAHSIEEPEATQANDDGKKVRKKGKGAKKKAKATKATKAVVAEDDAHPRKKAHVSKPL